ncbi:hypothetical protein Tco_1123962 [Tanacetum coccineum]|uniref:Uncharacterized protein n=1 Tax=Tanacetum coccineum TaxID=301880 RepID=A0ABQ5J7N3_9ASTR
MEVEPLDKTQLEDLGLNTCNHDIPLSSREVPSFDEPKTQPHPLHNFPSLDVSLGDERGPEPPIKPLSPDSFRMKVVDLLTIHTPPSPHLASFHPKDTYCYYHPCIDDPKKHYGFKPGLLGQSGSLGVDFLKLEMIEEDLELECNSVPAPVPAHRQAGTVVDNHNQSENRSHIIRTSMTHIEAVEVDHKSRVYYRKEKD